MKNIIQILTVTLLSFILSSCQKQDYSIQEFETDSTSVEVESRSSSKECLTCDAISVGLETVSKDADCCTSVLHIELEATCSGGSRHMIYLDDEILTYFTSKTMDIEIDHCAGDDFLLTVVGLDDLDDSWTDVCFRNYLDCMDTSFSKMSNTDTYTE